MVSTNTTNAETGLLMNIRVSSGVFLQQSGPGWPVFSGYQPPTVVRNPGNPVVFKRIRHPCLPVYIRPRASNAPAINPTAAHVIVPNQAAPHTQREIFFCHTRAENRPHVPHQTEMKIAMTHPHKTSFMSVVISLIASMACSTASAIEVTNLAGLEDIFGRYAPGGDCTRQPQILVELSGLTFELPGATEQVTNPEYAASYGAHDYKGISKWIFPFRLAEGYAILMTFNANEQKGALHIDPHDEGWCGGPPLSPRNKALVAGSPYALCK